jgi:galactonate dehydratase
METANSYKSAEELEVVRLRRSRLERSINLHRTQNVIADTEHAIKEVKFWTLREPVSKRTYSVIKIQTNSGIVGFGECSAITNTEFEGARKVIVGMPATSFEIAAPLMSDFPTAWAGFNIAMLDVVGKITKAPVYQVLGGPTRHKARALAALTGNTDEALIASMNRAFRAGYKAFIVPIPKTTNPNSGQGYVLSIVKRLQALRTAGGQDVDFVLDGANKLTPGDAQMITSAIEQFHVLWFNEPCSAVGLGALHKISSESVVPLGLGSHITQGKEVQDLLREDTVDIVRPSIGLNGISQIRRMAVLAETYYIAVGPTHDGGPIATAAALHLAASIPNFFIQQIPFPEAQEDQQMRLELTSSPIETVKDGYASLLTGHGLGIAVNEKSLEKYKIS